MKHALSANVVIVPILSVLFAAFPGHVDTFLCYLSNPLGFSQKKLNLLIENLLDLSTKSILLECVK